MNHEMKELIEARARALGRIAQNILLEDETDELAGIAFRWAFLILRRPRCYFDAFHHGEIRLDPELLGVAFEHFAGYLPGAAGLLRVEREIVEEHNRECQTLRNGAGTVVDARKIIRLIN